MKLFKHLKIAQKLPLVAIGAAFVASAAIGAGSYGISASTVRALTEEKLTTVAQERARELSALLLAMRDDLLVTAVSGTTVTSLGNLALGWDQIGSGQTTALQQAFIDNNPHPADQRSLLDEAGLNNGITYDMSHSRLHPGFRGQLQARGYGDIYLFDGKGNLVYSVNKGPEFATSFATGGQFADTPLGEVYRQAAAMTEPGSIAYADIAPYAADPDAPAGFMAAPVFSGANPIGVVAFKLSSGRISEMMGARLGLGETGESLLVGTDHLLRHDSPFSEVDDTLVTAYRAPLVEAALGGETLPVTEVDNYRGMEMLAVAVPLTFEDQHWALVTTIGKDEAMTPVTQMGTWMFVIAAVVLFVAGALGYLFSRTIARPLTQLTGTMAALADGELETDVRGAERADEIGAMARAVEVFRANSLTMREMTETERAASENRRVDRAQMMAQLQQAFGAVVDAAVDGDFSQRVETQFDDAELNGLARSVNNLVETVDRGLAQTGVVLAALAQTDLTQRVEGEYRGAFQRLKIDTNAVAEKLSEIVNQLRGTSRTLKMATGEILSGADDLSQRTTRQAATIEETSAAMEQLATTVLHNAERANEASQTADTVTRTAEDGGTVMGQATEAMERITTSSGKISNIIGLIDDIAFQTNLLALNASVEAARAGDAGKGFAVVAVEVRRLAQSAAAASAEVKVLIEQSGSEVSSGSRLVAEAAAKLEAMLSAARASNELMSGIARESREQASAIEEVNAAVQSLDEMTQHNAALVEQTNAAIQQTEIQASELDRIVDVFTIADGGDGRSVRHRAA